MRGGVPESEALVSTTGQSISLRDIVFTLYRRRWIVLVIALPIIAMGGTSLFRQVGAYTASARVVVELAKVDLPQWNTSGRNIDYDRELSTLTNIAMSLPVITEAAEALADSVEVIKSLDERLVDLEAGSDLVGYLIENQDVSVVGESNILEFRFTSADPRISLMAVGALRDAFVEYHIHGRQDTSAIAYYQEQITSVRAAIDSLLVLRTEVMNASGYNSMKDELRNQAGQLSELENELYQAVTNRRTLEVQYRSLSGYLDKDPRLFPMGVDESRSHTLVYWRNTVSKHEDQLNSILSVHTPESIPVERQQRLLDGALDSLRKEEIAYVESIRLAMMTTRGKESALRDQITQVRARNNRAPEAYQKISLLDVEVNSLRGLLEDLQGKWGEVRISTMADERVSNVSKLTNPQLVMVLSSGKTVVYFVLIVFFAIALGVVAALIMESMDHRVYAVRDVEDHLQLPVFSSITKAD